jgi:hypothetical protein
MYKVEKNIPAPQVRNHGIAIYPFKTMEKGDSFFIPAKGKKEQQSKRKAVTTAAHNHKVKITARAVEDGVRVWLIGWRNR